MKLNKALGIARNIALTSLVTSYIGQSFYRWNFNPEQWGPDGRGAFMWTYVMVLTIYGFGFIMLTSITKEETQ
jgi:hypothetical protein